MPEIISRADALCAGVRNYFTGVPCRHGHIAERSAKFNFCTVCIPCRPRAPAQGRARKPQPYRYRYRPEYHIANRERNNARSRARQEVLWANGSVKRRGPKFSDRELQDRRNARKRAKVKVGQPGRRCIAYAKAIALFLLDTPEFREARRIAKRLSEKLRLKADPERRRAKQRQKNQRRRAQKKRAEGQHTASDIRRIYKDQQNGLCAYFECCQTELDDSYHVDHIQPLARGGSNYANNLQLCCAPCNISKGASDPIEFARSLGLLL